MIMTKIPKTGLFYMSDEIYRPPRTNFYIRLNSVVGSWRELCAPVFDAFASSIDGRPVDPVVYFKIFLIAYFEGIVADTALAERVADSLALREFVGYGPAERTPDHSSIGRVRSQLAKTQGLDEVMDRVVAMCAQAGLISGDMVAADSTLLPANASLSSLHSVTTGISVGEYFKQFREQEAKASPQNETLAPEAPPAEPKGKKGKKKMPPVSNEEFRSTTDPDARITSKGSSPAGMYYKVTHVTDSKHQVILSAQSATADTGECDAATAPLEEAKRRLQASELKLGTVVADAGYDDSKFHGRLEEMGVIPLTNFQVPETKKPEGFAKKDFTYDPERNLYVCPNGKELPLDTRKSDRINYRASETDCAQCPLKHACLDEKAKARSIRRTPDEPARERNIERCHTDEGREQLKQRKTVVEPPFGHLKTNGGLSRINCRTNKRVQVKITFAALAWNLMKRVKKLGGSRVLARFLCVWRSISQIFARRTLRVTYVLQ